MTSDEAIEYGKVWDAALAERGDTEQSDARVFLAWALLSLKERKTGKWNVITKRPMDAEEREVWEVEMGEIADEEAYLYLNLPEEGEEVLVCTETGRIFIDTMCRDEGCYFEEYGDIEGIVAWMPLPEPFYGLGQAFDPD